MVRLCAAHLRCFAATVGTLRLNGHGLAKGGGSAWESNPASPNQRGATDFEDREGHRAPFTSERIVLRIENRELRMRTAEAREAIADSAESAIRDPHSEMRLPFDQSDVAGARTFL